MEKEIRLSNIKDLSKYSDFDRIGIGNEACFHKLPNPLLIKDTLNELQEKCRIVTPFIPQRHLLLMEKILEKILDNYNKKINITINDYGLLHLIYKNNLNKHFNIYLGRLLAITREQTPWIDQINRLEDEYLVKTTMQNAANYHLFIEFLKQYNIKGIETNLLDNELESLLKIKNQGFEILGHFNRAICAVTRVCPTAKFYGKKVPTCVSCCDRELHLKLAEILSVKTGEKIDDRAAKETMPDLIVHGNVYLFDKQENEKFKQILDVLILDIRNDSNVDKMIKL